MMIQVPDAAKEMIKKWEGFEAHAYRDSVGVLTVGYGFTEPALNAIGFEMKKFVSKTEGDVILEKLLADHYGPEVSRMCRRKGNRHELGALCSLAYNIGLFALEGSTLVQYVQKGEMEKAAREFNKWVYADGKVLDGLVRRREDERNYFEKDQPLYAKEDVDPLPVREVEPHETPTIGELLPDRLNNPNSHRADA